MGISAMAQRFRLHPMSEESCIALNIYLIYILYLANDIDCSYLQTRALTHPFVAAIRLTRLLL